MLNTRLMIERNIFISERDVDIGNATASTLGLANSQRLIDRWVVLLGDGRGKDSVVFHASYLRERL